MLQFPFSFWKVSAPPTPQPMFYTDMGSGLFADSSNWFKDAGFTIPAGRTPINGDELWIYGAFTDNAPPLSIASYNNQGQATAIQTASLNVVSTGGIYVSTGIWGGTNDLGAVGYFSGTGINEGNFTGNCDFVDDSKNNYQVSGVANFYNNAINDIYGSVYQPIFHDYSANYGNFADAIFYDFSDNVTNGGNSGIFYNDSSNSGSLSMDSYFYDNSINLNGGSVSTMSGYTARFYNSSVNEGSVGQNAEFNDFSYTTSTSYVYGTGTFYNNTANNGYVSTGIFYANSGDFGTVYSASYYNSSQSGLAAYNGYSMYYDSTANYGVNAYQAYYNGSSVNYGYSALATFSDITANYGISYGLTKFYGYSFNSGTVDEAEFYDLCENVAIGVVSLNASFYNDSNNYGTVNGDGYFYDNSDQLGTVLGVTTCSTTGTCP